MRSYDIPGAEDLPGGGIFQGEDAICRHFTASFEAFDTEEITPDMYKLDAVGDYVFLRGTASAVVKSTGQQFTATAVHEFEFKSGRILRHTIIVDTSGVRRSMQNDAEEL